MIKKILPLALLLLTACTQSSVQAPNVPPPPVAETLDHVYQVAEYTIEYPNAFTVTENDTLIAEEFEIQGTSFTFPESYRAGNVLDEAKVHIGWHIGECENDHPRTSMTTLGGNQLDKKEWKGAAAGNLYEGITYTKYGSPMPSAPTKCQNMLLTLYMHSCNLGSACSDGHTGVLDKKPLIDMFTRMLGTLKITGIRS